MTDRRAYDDEEAQRIIARAAEIDADARGRLDTPTLRALAAEQGISESAIERALREHAVAPPRRASLLYRYRGVVWVAAIAAALLIWAVLRRTLPLPF